MRYSNTAITELSAKYRSVLKKCAFLNAAILVGGALLTTGAMAETVIEGEIDANVLVQPNETTIFNNVTASGIVDPTYDGAVTYIYNGGTATIKGTSNFTSNSSAVAGGVASNAGTLTINDDASFISNTAPYGGAIYNIGEMTVNGNSQFTSNSAVYAGGALYNNDGSVIVDNATFKNNEVFGEIVDDEKTYKYTATDGKKYDVSGGAIYSTGLLTVKNSEFEGNKAGMYSAITAGSGLTVSNSQFINNEGKSAYAVIGDFTSTSGGVTIEKSSFKNNYSPAGSAVALFSRDHKALITDSEFEANRSTSTEEVVSASASGAVFVGSEAMVTVNNTTFKENTAGIMGAAITTRPGFGVNNNHGTLDVLNSKFVSNSSLGDGGAIWNAFYKSDADNNNVTVASSVFEKNSAVKGGAVYNDSQADKNGNQAAIKISDSTFTENTATRDGGAIYNGGKLTILNSRFTGNKVENDTFTVEGGAISNNGGTITISDSSFVGNKAIHQNNSSTHGGAIYNNRGTVTITGSEFIGNESTGAAVSSGGAIQVDGSLDPDAVVNVSNSVFKNNKSSWGGAIQNRGKLTLTNVDFIQNIAEFSDPTSGGVGGALENNVGEATITGGSFSENSAFEGGAIHNRRKITINGVSFTNNSATETGGAIVNESTLILTGTNTFSGNKVNGDLNDIHNTGTLNVSDALTLDGGISGSGNMVLADGALLTAKAGTTTISNNITNEGTSKLALTIANGFSDDTYQLVTGSLDQEFDIQENSLYSILPTTTKGTYSIAKKSTDEVVENLVNEGATAQEAATISAIADSSLDHPVLNAISEAVQTGDVKTAAKAAKDLAPTTSQAALGISKDVQSLLTNAATARMASLAGRSGGDVFKGGSMWVQGLFNHTKQDSTSRNEGFKANSKGIAFGIDGKLNDAVTVGLGYGYTRTDADAGNRDIDVDGNNVFAYAEYAPDAWYVNGVLNFGYGRYTEKKSPLGVSIKSKYDVYTYGVNVMTGYAFDSGLTPEGGLRYLLVDQKSYDDGVEKIKTSNNDVLTAVLGAKYGYKVKAKDWMFTPNVRLAATYDLMSDESKAVSSITAGSSYQIKGERLHRLGFEAGVGVTSTWNNWDFTLSYDGGFRQDYQSHTGTLKAKYHF